MKENALADLPLLEKVVKFKNRFYPCPWAKYDTAIPGTLKLLPTPIGETELQADYRNMEAMIFRSPPPWTKIMSVLAALENEINALS